MKRMLVSAALALSLATPVMAKEVAGVKVAETASVSGKELKLNGAGLRKKFIFDVYIAALYVENTSKDPAQIITSDQPKRVVMTMLRDLDKKSIVDAVVSGFESNAGPNMPKLKERLDKFAASIPDVKKGDQLTITYLPEQGTTVTSKSGKEAKVEGKDFADAMFAVWLGKEPVQESLKNGMLGKE